MIAALTTWQLQHRQHEQTVCFPAKAATRHRPAACLQTMHTAQHSTLSLAPHLVLHRCQVHRRAAQDVFGQQQRRPAAAEQNVHHSAVAPHHSVVQRRACLAVTGCRVGPLQCTLRSSSNRFIGRQAGRQARPDGTRNRAAVAENK